MSIASVDEPIGQPSIWTVMPSARLLARSPSTTLGWMFPPTQSEGPPPGGTGAPRVEIKLFDGEDAVRLAGFLEMGRPCSEDRGHRGLGMDQDFFAEKRARIEPAQLGEPEVAPGLDRLHKKPDPVHVGGEERARARRIAGAVDPRAEISHAVPLHAVGVEGEGPLDLPRGGLLVARRARERGQMLQPFGRASLSRARHSLRI